MLGTNGKPPQRGLDDQLEQPLRTAAQLGEFIVAQLAVRERLRRGGRQFARRIEHGCVGAPAAAEERGRRRRPRARRPRRPRPPIVRGAIDPNAPRSRAGQAGVRGSSDIDALTRDHSLSGSRLGASSPSASSASRANRSSVAASSKPARLDIVVLVLRRWFLLTRARGDENVTAVVVLAQTHSGGVGERSRRVAGLHRRSAGRDALLREPGGQGPQRFEILLRAARLRSDRRRAERALADPRQRRAKIGLFQG
jgi:hypothetical protein